MTRITRSWTTIAVCLAAIVLLLTTPAGRVRAQTPKATLIDPIAASAILTRGGPGSTYQIFCGLWRVDGGFESSIRIRNELVVAPIDVTPILFMADGAEYDLPTVHVATGGLAGVDVNQALAAAPASVGAHLSQLGSVELRYQYSSPGHLVGSVQMLNTPESLIFVTPFNGVDEMPASEHTLEGLWWRRDPGISGYVSFANVTENPAGVRVQAIDADGRPGPSVNLSLAPHATEMRNLEDLIGGVPGVRAQAGGLRVTYTAPMGGVMVTGGLVNEREGYSAAIPFVFHDNDPSQGAAAITYGSAGLMSGAPDPSMGFPKGTRFAPYAALRNTTTSRLSVSLSLTWMQTNGSPMTQPLGVTTLGPLQAEQVDMTAALARAGAGNLNGNLNLAVSFTGHAGDLIIATGSVDQTGSFVFEVEPQGVGKTNSKQAAYWTTRDGSDTMYTIWNPTTQAQDVVMTFHYGDGSGTYRLPLHFAANASMAIDMAALTRNQQPDEDGFVMTGSVGEGSAIIESAGGRRTPVTLVVSGGTFNVRTGTCGQICINCCGYTRIGPLATLP